jgi:diguanylate cyclase (GGDEF)-like protein
MQFAARLGPFLRLFSRVSLRAWLIAILLVALSALLLDRGREAAATRERAIEHAYADLASAARTGAERQASLIAQAKVILRLAADLPPVLMGNGAACHDTLVRIMDDAPWLTGISVLNLHGYQTCSNSERQSTENYADRAYFRDAIESGSFALSDYIVGKLSGSPLFVLAYPLKQDGVVKGALRASIDLDWMSRLAAKTGSSHGTEVQLLDSSATVLAAYPDPEAWVGRGMADQPGFTEALSRPADGHAVTATLDGRKRLVGHARLPDTDAILVVMLPLDGVLFNANLRAWREFATIVIGGIVLLAAIWLGGELLVMRPLRGLTRTATSLGSGELAVRMQTEGLAPELRRLGESFNDMAEHLADREAQLRQANQTLASLASKDSLTGVANRRAFDERMASEWSRACRDRKLLALLAVDVDHFKRFNDTYGHLEGDNCLRQIAEVLDRSARRGGDFAARIGGEEFALILPAATLSDAANVAERIRAEIAALGIEHRSGQEGRVTISVGVAATSTATSQGPHTLINHADAALYQAKRAGRNRVSLAESKVSLAS